MKTRVALASLLALILCSITASIQAQTITLSTPFPSVAPSTNSTNFNVPSNVVAQITYAYCPANSGYSSSITVTVKGASAFYQSSASSGGVMSNLPTIVGPATITLTATCSTFGLSSVMAFCTIQTTSASSFTPSTSVVIPNDDGGPVTIILESSVDLVNWTSALPGTYGTTSSNRFFRVRAQR